jgi:hypothetical protein
MVSYRSVAVRALRVPLFAASLLVAAAVPLRAQDALSGDKQQKADAVKADLLRLSELERAYYTQNKKFTDDLKALNFAPSSGAQVTMSYASARAWAANATHPVIAPFACFIIVSSATGSSPAEKPFCQDQRRSSAASALAAAGTTPAPTKTAAPTTSVPTTPAPVPTAAPPVTSAPAPSAPATEQPKAVAQAPKQQPPAKQAPKPAPTSRRAQPNRPRTPVVPGPVLVAPMLPAQGNVSAAARATTRQASAAAGGPVENVTVQQFSDRLSQITNGALDALNAKAPELVRDPYESTAEFEARRAAAAAQFARREAEYFARSARTLVVQLPVKDAKYDADREVLEFSVDPVELPTARSFSTESAGALTVTCYTRPVFWCGPEAGMTYEGGDLWRVPRARARELDVLRSPMTMTAKFAVGYRDDTRGPSLTVLELDLQAKGQSVARWMAPGTGAPR